MATTKTPRGLIIDLTALEPPSTGSLQYNELQCLGTHLTDIGLPTIAAASAEQLHTCRDVIDSIARFSMLWRSRRSSAPLGRHLLNGIEQRRDRADVGAASLQVSVMSFTHRPTTGVDAFLARGSNFMLLSEHYQIVIARPCANELP